MINRRNFMKYSGLAVLSLSAGYNIGRIYNSNKNKFFVYAFLPEDKILFKELLTACKRKISTHFITVIEPGKDTENLTEMFKSNFQRSPWFSNNIMKVRVSKIKHSIKSDLIVGTLDRYIIDPKSQPDKSFSEIRNKVKGRDASLFFSLEFEENKFLSSLFHRNGREVVMENEKGVIDRIKLNKDFNNVEFESFLGKTVIKIENGLVSVQKSSCKHKLCEKQGYISQPGEIIACAPNKTIIRIENT